MMNETLQKELSAHFKKINDRKEHLDKFESSLKQKDTSFENLKEEIEAEVTRKIKEYLDKKNFDYENERNNSGDRIIFEDGKLKIREYKHHGFNYLNVINSDKLNEFLPNGLIKSRKIITEKIEEIKNIILEFKENIKLKKGIPIQRINGDKIEKSIIKNIEISFNCEEEHSYENRHRYSYSYENRTYKSRSEEFKIKLNGSSYSYNVDDYLYSDKFFNNILLLIEKFKKHIQEIQETKDKMKSELKSFVFNDIDKMIVLGELKE